MAATTADTALSANHAVEVKIPHHRRKLTTVAAASTATDVIFADVIFAVVHE